MCRRKGSQARIHDAVGMVEPPAQSGGLRPPEGGRPLAGRHGRDATGALGPIEQGHPITNRFPLAPVPLARSRPFGTPDGGVLAKKADRIESEGADELSGNRASETEER